MLRSSCEFELQIMLTNHLIGRIKKSVWPVWIKSLYPSVLLEGIQRTGGKHPQRVVGQNDEHVHSFSLLWGPRDWEDGVCAAAWQLGHTHTWSVSCSSGDTRNKSPNCSQKLLLSSQSNANSFRHIHFNISLLNKMWAFLVQSPQHSAVGACLWKKNDVQWLNLVSSFHGDHRFHMTVTSCCLLPNI